MEKLNSSRVQAIHRDWRGFLNLSEGDMTVVHEASNNKGTYQKNNGALTVNWDNYPPDTFHELSGVYLHDQAVVSLPILEYIHAVRISGEPVIAKSVRVAIPESGQDVELRLNTTDIPTFAQIFLSHEYSTPHLPAQAKNIVDLGANIGLATLFFAMQYSDAKILAVEPDEENYRALTRNTSDLADRVLTEHAAVWVRDGTISLHTENTDGKPLGAWGVQVSDRIDSSNKSTRCYRLASLLERAGFEHVDILKVDIEGAELELFSEDVDAWLPKVDTILVETHDRFKPGSEDAVRSALGEVFEEFPPIGENLIFKRRL